MSHSNLAILTKSHNIIASKKRAKKDQVKEVLFDEVARRDYLTGFHKRNVQKRETAKKKAIEREKQQRLETRREQRQMLAERAVQNAKEVEKAYGAQLSEDEDAEWDGLNSSGANAKGKGRAAEHEEEFEDEEQLATVTVVEDFDPEALLYGPSRKTGPEDEMEEDSAPPPRPASLKRGPPQLKKAQFKTASKARSIKYQTNAARKTERNKQQKRKLEKAQRAGGKARRGGSTGGRGRR